MDGSKKDKEASSLSEIAQNVEVKLTETILRWRYKKDGETPPADDQMKARSRTVTEKVNQIVARRGKNIWRQWFTKEDED